MCGFMLLATPAAAQSTTEDGIRAMIRGDYQGAARILRPLADERSAPDPVAAFFLAMLYDTGQAVRYDQNRACGLFRRAAEQPNPFVEQSSAIVASIRNQFGGPKPPFFCVANESWQGGPPQSFVLGPGHRIVFADTSITVIHGDRESRGLASLGSPGAVFLPIQYTPLDVTRPIVVRRHFFQLFGWIADTTANTSSWTLIWGLIEVVADKWIPVAGEKLVVVSGPTRPASYDVSSLVRLRVNENGEAEYAILAGSAARTEVIPWQGSR